MDHRMSISVNCLHNHRNLAISGFKKRHFAIIKFNEFVNILAKKMRCLEMADN